MNMHAPRPAPTRRLAFTLLVLATLALAGCGVSDRLGKQMDGTVGDILFDQQERVIVAFKGDESLNLDAEGNPLSVVVRIYQLDALTAFNAANSEALWASASDSLGDSLLGEREVVVLPGRTQVEVAPMAPGTRYVAVVAFFRQIEGEGWRLVFDAEAMRKDGILTSPDGVVLTLEGSRITPMDEDSAELVATAGSLARAFAP
ncbi:MAG: type VI secretion system lipoprotein TssJ [Gammaproteobacteria bacterium]|nr:type VI secretion system lipoprotein TssJ [Gammaproteobacteria bacterium]